ncbi:MULTISPECIES: TetR/AcrR family transcriptional regulator [unclassified Microbacterium]|uniref:TetR/AcrR family transcriptional regulator n=1 Tax=unclassified Microbacterium TaxID=2609290 RepID=UPI001E1A77E0|nr:MULTISPECIES: TetR/AcrR family transcriptional regulator [unclassified Microbacterium]CAH0170453.1 putative HTH-type transcriptional regulator Rv2250c [Microbacterium sp. Bi121]HWK77939.1 helix-turn-helix domain-containing protein [Microbacterium sp.]
MEKRQAIPILPIEAELPSWDDADAHILERASDLIASRGTARLTIAELAREARVSRPTIYRRWASADEVVRAALLRQTMTVIRRLEPEVSTRERLVSETLRFADLFREDPVFGRLLASEPDAFTQYSLERVGSSQRAMLRWLADAIAHAQNGGTVRAGDRSDMSVMLLLIVQSAVLSYNAVSSLIGIEEWHTELSRAVDGYLRP